MTFEIKKKATLAKMTSNDKSKKGSVDADILDLVTFINESDDYYTTSSCSGRIVLMNKMGERKDQNEWLLAKHAPITEDEFKAALSQPLRKEIWFMQEAPIIHICARTVEAGNKMLQLAHVAGLKRTGIISLTPRVILEFMGSEKMETIVYDAKELIDENYIPVLVKYANERLLKAKARMKKFEEQLQNL